MKVFYIHKWLFVVVILLIMVGNTSCCHDNDDPVPTPSVKVHSTHIIYMVAENSLSPYVNGDKEEIEKALQMLPDSSRVVVYVDDATSSRLYAGRGGDKKLEQVKVYDRNVCSTDSAEMSLVMQDILQSYPAKRYTLTLWSHGSGWGVQKKSVPKTSFGIDNGRRSTSDSGTQMNVPTLARVLSHFPHFDMILFDACFMQCIEVAYEMKECTDYIIGSSAEIPGYGAPYDSVLLKMDEGSAIETAKTYVNAYADKEVKGVSFGIILSVIKTDELDSLASVSRLVNKNVFAYPRTAKLAEVQAYNKQITGNYTEYYDINSLLNHQVGYCITKELYNQWLEVAKRAIPYHYQTKQWMSSVGGFIHYLSIIDSENCMAVSVFVPNETYKQNGTTANYRLFKWYEASGMNLTGW